MITIRNTSRYDTETVEYLVRYALIETGLTDAIHVHVKNSRRTRSGVAYYYRLADTPRTARNQITVTVGSPDRFPHVDGYWTPGAKREWREWADNGREGPEPTGRRGGRWPEITLADWQEAIVSVTAHEAKHIERRRERVKQSEPACEHHAAWVLNRWRITEGRIQDLPLTG